MDRVSVFGVGIVSVLGVVWVRQMALERVSVWGLSRVSACMRL